MKIQAQLNVDLDDKLKQHDIKLEEMSEQVERKLEKEEEKKQPVEEPEAAETIF